MGCEPMRLFDLLQALLEDKKGNTVFTCFGIWHILYLILILGAITAAVLFLRKQDDMTRKKWIRGSANLAFGLYILDLFLMPFAYGQIDLEKLPFHACTAMCVMCFISSRSPFWGRLRHSFALLGLISNLVYVIYPAGVGWYQIHPLCYRVVQTLLFHGIMSCHGILVLFFDDVPTGKKEFARDLLVLAGMVLWALLGNTLYNGVYTKDFNWFFVQQDPFYLLPKAIAPYIMPFVTFAAFATVMGGVRLIHKNIKKV